MKTNPSAARVASMFSSHPCMQGGPCQCGGGCGGTREVTMAGSGVVDVAFGENERLVMPGFDPRFASESGGRRAASAERVAGLWSPLRGVKSFRSPSEAAKNLRTLLKREYGGDWRVKHQRTGHHATFEWSVEGSTGLRKFRSLDRLKADIHSALEGGGFKDPDVLVFITGPTISGTLGIDRKHLKSEFEMPRTAY